MRALLIRELDRLEALYDTGRPVSRLPTGLMGWDLTAGGLRRGGVHLLIGPSRSGLSSLALTIGANSVLLRAQPVLFVSGLPDGEIAQRAWSARSLVPIDKIERGRLSEADWQELAHSTGQLAESLLRVAEPPRDGCNLTSLLKSEISAMPTAIVVIDDLEVSQADDLRVIAQDHDVAILVVASETSKQVLALAEQADTLAVVRPDGPAGLSTRLATICIERNRYGPLGAFRLAFLEECLVWVDVFDADRVDRFGPVADQLLLAPSR